MHIADHIAQTLREFGWRVEAPGVYAKRIRGFADAGEFSDGTRIVRLQLDPNGRWLERIDGWGKVERCIDLRDHTAPTTAINAALD